MGPGDCAMIELLIALACGCVVGVIVERVFYRSPNQLYEACPFCGVREFEHRSECPVAKMGKSPQPTQNYNMCPRFKLDQWVRSKRDSSLYKIITLLKVEPANGIGFYCQGVDGVVRCFCESEIKPAYPVAGEWWHSLDCRTHGRGMKRPYKYYGNPVCSSVEEETILCGCLVPVNFGRGDE